MEQQTWYADLKADAEGERAPLETLCRHRKPIYTNDSSEVIMTVQRTTTVLIYLVVTYQWEVDFNNTLFVDGRFFLYTRLHKYMKICGVQVNIPHYFTSVMWSTPLGNTWNMLNVTSKVSLWNFGHAKTF